MTIHCNKHKRPKVKVKDKHLCPVCENPFTNELHATVHKYNRNVLLVVEGPPGTGKSYWCLKKAEELDPAFFARKNLTAEDLESRILFRPSDFAKVLNEKTLYKGAVIIIEEGGIQADHRKWHSFNNMVFNYIFQTFRFMNLIVIMNVPVIHYVDSDARKLFQYHVQTVGVTRDNMNQVKIMSQQYSSTMKKIYRKHLRYKINGRWIKFNLWREKKAGTRLCNQYEKMHKKFKAGLIESLAKEMKLLDKQESLKRTRALVNEDEAVDMIIGNPDEYITRKAGRSIVNKARVEIKFGIGRSISERIKQRAEMRLNEKTEDR